MLPTIGSWRARNLASKSEVSILQSLIAPSRYYVGPVWLNRQRPRPIFVWLAQLHAVRRALPNPAYTKRPPLPKCIDSQPYKRGLISGPC